MRPPKTTKNPVFPRMSTLGTAKILVNNFRSAISLGTSTACDELQSLIQDLSTNRCFVSSFEISGLWRPCEETWPKSCEERAAPQHRADGRTARREGAPSGRGAEPAVSRVLSWAVIPLGASSPIRSSNLPGGTAGRGIASLFGLAPGGVCRAGPLPDSRCALTAPFHPCHAPVRAVRRSALCCTFRRLAPPRRYLAPCPVEPGLSSAPRRVTRLPGRLRGRSLPGLEVFAGRVRAFGFSVSAGIKSGLRWMARSGRLPLGVLLHAFESAAQDAQPAP